MGERLEAGEIEVQALRDLLELAVRLKETGILGTLKELLAEGEEGLRGLQDTGLMRLAVLAGAMLEAARRLDNSRVAGLRENAEDAGYCLLSTLAETSPAEAQPRGVMGLVSALRDPDVQKGLGYIIAIAKNLGACLRRLESKGGGRGQI